MPRRKVKKPATKQKKSNNMLAIIAKSQKDFLNAPSKLAAEVNKEISALKKKQNQLSKSFEKTTQQSYKAEKQVNNLKQANSTRSGKKQFAIAKKSYTELLKTKQNQFKQVNANANTLQQLQDAYEKLSAMQKHFNQFAKTWSKPNKPVKAKKADEAPQLDNDLEPETLESNESSETMA